MKEGRVPGQCDVLVAWPAGNVLVSRPTNESGLKPSLTTTHAKASERVIATLRAGKTDGDASWDASGDGSCLHP
ncbi:MAG TPA: hypothetical protein VIM51_06020 [Desulfosporosinus sp.]